MKKYFYALCLIICLCLTGGCAAVLLGAGAGAGVYSYINGELKSTYDTPYEKTLEAVESVCEELKITITENNDEGIITTLKGHQPGDNPVTIKVTIISPESTEVGVRVGLVGVWDRSQAETIQSYITKALGMERE